MKAVSLALSFYACVVSPALCLSSKLNYSFDVAIRDAALVHYAETICVSEISFAKAHTRT